MMISSKKLIKMARKWRTLAAVSRKRISFAKGVVDGAADNCNTSSSTADKGHFVVYTADQSRFVIPLDYLNNGIFRELLKMAEEECGLLKYGPTTLPCDAVFVEYAVSLIRRRTAKDPEKALHMSISTGRCLSSLCLQQGQSNQQSLISSY